MSDQIYRWGKAIVEAFPSYWWQLYLACFIGGFIFALCLAVWVRNSARLERWGALFRFLLYSATISVLTAIGLEMALHHSFPWQSMCVLYDHLVGFIVDGTLLAALVASSGIIRSSSVSKDSLPGILLDPKIIVAARFWMVVFYALCGLAKFVDRETIDFFHSSGYSAAFFFFIATWELGWGLALVWRRTALFALGALSIDMFGAIYTHYHNYFARGFAGPFGNSVDALRMLGLIAYLAFALTRQTQDGQGTIGVA
jgi:hypothetical protein